MRAATAIRIVGLAALVLMAVRGGAAAGGLQVTPTKFHLSAKAKTGVLTLTNDGAEEIRIQATAYRWTQSATGEVVLAATTDVVVYPSLFTLAAGKDRTVRVGVDGAIGKTEVTYRLILEELPPLDRVETDAPKVRVLTRMSIPVFVRTAKLVTKAAIRKLALRDGRVSFAVVNTGSTYFVLERVRLVARDAAGEVVVDRTITGWYVLAGDRWTTTLEVDPDLCARIVRLEVEATSAKHHWDRALDLEEDGCGP